MPLTVEGSVPILLFGAQDQMQGEVWLNNATGSDIGISAGTLTVDFVPPATGTISFPSNAAVPAGTSRRLALNMSIQPVTPPGTYTATVALTTSDGPLNVAASAVVASTYFPVLAPQRFTFTGVTASTTFDGTLVVRNRGNVPVVVNSIPDETVAEIIISPQVLEVGAGGAVTVEPAPAVVTGGTVTFTNPTPTINPGDWTAVPFTLTTPAVITANRQFRVVPRVANQRFIVELLT
jgi:hypothetical protein